MIHKGVNYIGLHRKHEDKIKEWEIVKIDFHVKISSVLINFFQIVCDYHFLFCKLFKFEASRSDLINHNNITIFLPASIWRLHPARLSFGHRINLCGLYYLGLVFRDWMVINYFRGMSFKKYR